LKQLFSLQNNINLHLVICLSFLSQYPVLLILRRELDLILLRWDRQFAWILINLDTLIFSISHTTSKQLFSPHYLFFRFIQPFKCLPQDFVLA